MALSLDFGLRCEDYCFYETSACLSYIRGVIFNPKTYIHKKSYITTHIIASGYSPLTSAIIPLTDALLRGDKVVLSPSVNTRNTAKELKKLIEMTFDKDTVRVFLDTDLSKSKVPYKDSSHVKYLSFLHREIKSKYLYKFVKDKFLACGQYSESPDYIIVKRKDRDILISKLVVVIEMLIGSDPLIDEDYGRIRDKENYDRLLSIAASYPSIYGGAKCHKTLQIGPILLDVPDSSPILHRKIYGPIIPIVTVTED